MSFIVVYQDDAGTPRYELCGDLDAAVGVAERMRNVDGVESPRIFRAEEVRFDFRPYYRVEVVDAEAALVEPVSVAPPPVEPEAVEAANEAPEAVADVPEIAEVPTPTEVPAPVEAADSAEPAPAGAPEVVAESTGAWAETPAADAVFETPESSDDVDDVESPEPVISTRRGLFGR